jgi:hypothetical protein
MVLVIICVTPITPAIAKLPVNRYAIKNVAPEPVTRQLMVLTKLLRGESANKRLVIDYFHATFATNVPFLNAIFYSALRGYWHIDVKVFYQVFITVLKYSPDQITFAVLCVVSYVISVHNMFLTACLRLAIVLVSLWH